METGDPQSLDDILLVLRAVAEPSRLRLLALCAAADLTVSEMVDIVGQSQPGVSRHLKLLCDAGLLERHREGAWIFHRLVGHGAGAVLVRQALALIVADDPVLSGDAQRLAAVRRARAEAAESYFRTNAGRWAEVRSLHIDEADVETAILAVLGDRRYQALLDIGTGTGRILELLAPMAVTAEGVDSSREMLALARSRIEGAGLGHCSVRLGDMYRLGDAGRRFDLVTIHQVLHFALDPAAVIAEAARVLAPGGRLAIVDFAPHGLESLRDEHNHRRLGFTDSEVSGWCRAAGLAVGTIRHLPGRPLTVTLWLAESVADAASRPVPPELPASELPGPELPGPELTATVGGVA
jgi:ArsR family transcriptional regulator